MSRFYFVLFKVWPLKLAAMRMGSSGHCSHSVQRFTGWAVRVMSLDGAFGCWGVGSRL